MAELDSLQFGEPLLLWLLLAPAALSLLVLRTMLLRRRDARRFSAARHVPVRERFPTLGPTAFWGCLTLALGLVIVALARPQLETAGVRQAGIDLVVLLDGSASMHVRDVSGTRWQRSVRFLRALGDTMRWDQDRVALTLFAHIAAPQVRLTRDPNTFFFFLDHLADRPPFRLEDDTSWDTNIALGIEWGLRLVRRDDELRGPSPNGRQFVLLTDGQAWSGQVQEALTLARARDVPVSVVGVGTLRGGVIPDPKRTSSPGILPLRSSLDRESLLSIAAAGGGRYFELDRESDVTIASRIVEAARRRATGPPPAPTLQPFYWPFLLAAAALALGGVLFLREVPELWLVLLAAAATLAVIGPLLR